MKTTIRNSAHSSSHRVTTLRLNASFWAGLRPLTFLISCSLSRSFSWGLSVCLITVQHKQKGHDLLWYCRAQWGPAHCALLMINFMLLKWRAQLVKQNQSALSWTWRRRHAAVRISWAPPSDWFWSCMFIQHWGQICPQKKTHSGNVFTCRPEAQNMAASKSSTSRKTCRSITRFTFIVVRNSSDTLFSIIVSCSTRTPKLRFNSFTLLTVLMLANAIKSAGDNYYIC